MLKTLALVFLVIGLPVFVLSQPQSEPSIRQRKEMTGAGHSLDPPEAARIWVQSALEAMGGEERLHAIKTVSLKGSGHTNLLEQSERPEGPWLINYEQIAEVRDLEGHRFRHTVTTQGSFGPPESTQIMSEGMAATFLMANGKTSPMRAAPADEERLLLGPERLLLTALAAPDLRAASDTTLQGVPHHVAVFSLQKTQVHIFLNANTRLPTAVETLTNYPFDTFWSVWGDVRTRTYFSYWTLEAGGIRYPRQWDVFREGMPYKTFIISDLAFNGLLPADSFNISAEVRQAFASRPPVPVNDRALGRPDQPAVEITPGVVLIPGSWNVTLIRQADGIVVIEAPISSGYSAKVIAEAARRYPNVPVKAVISTSDSWPHIGGIRQYVARGIPVYCLDLNRPILERLISAPHQLAPDSLARTPRKANLRIVAGKTVVGNGANRLELYPVRTETGERMIMVYLPEDGLLYGSDLVQGAQADGSFFMPQYLSELMDAVKREGLAVQKVFAMHTGPTDWSKITSAVTKATEVEAVKRDN